MFKDKYRSDNDKINPDEALLKYLAKKMEDVENGEQVSAPAQMKRSWVRRHARPVLALAACFVVAVAGLAVYGQHAGIFTGKTSTADTSSANTGKVQKSVSYAEIYALIKSMESKTTGKTVGGLRSGTAEYAAADKATAASSIGSGSYSQTNVQVEGVDEADIVKTDGKYVYTLSNGTVEITGVQGGTMKTASKISISSADKTKETCYPIELFVQGDRLIVLESVYETDGSNSGAVYAEKNALIDTAYGYGANKTAAIVYDISDRTNPKLLNTIGQSGYYLSSRIVEGTLYLITNYYLYGTAEKGKPETYVPMLYNGSTGSAMAAGDICISAAPQCMQYAVVTAVNVKQPDGILSSKSVYGCGSTVYADTKNLLIASYATVETSRSTVTGAAAVGGNGSGAAGVAGAAVGKSAEAVAPDAVTAETAALGENSGGGETGGGTASDGKIASSSSADTKGGVSITYSSKTNMIRFSLNGGKIALEATGSIPGSLLNQYSMDEYNGVFRLVTTAYSYTVMQYGSGNTATVSYGSSSKSTNALYTLGQDLKVVGSITDVAPGENVYSVRFVGTVGYFVTFRQVDPLFAVDLSNPAKPKLLSELKIPGLSDYLHPYVDGLLFGLGRDADSQTGRVNGLKLSMFDVSDPSNVAEKQTLKLDENWSEASYNPKAILVSPERGLIAFPAENQYLVYAYSEDTGFTKKAAFTVDSNTGGFMRGVYINQTFYVCTSASITAYSMKDYSRIGTLTY